MKSAAEGGAGGPARQLQAIAGRLCTAAPMLQVQPLQRRRRARRFFTEFSNRLFIGSFFGVKVENMGAMKTFVAALAALTALTGPSTAMDAGDPVRMFAACAGRLSAVMEHQWLTDPPASEATATDRDRMIALLEAVGDPTDPALMSPRLEAKIAHAALLTRARFDPDAAARARAGRAAQAASDRCRALLLP